MKLTFELPSWLFFTFNIMLSFSICQGVSNKYYLNDYQKKTWRENVESLFQLICLTTLVFVFGNYSNTYPNIGTVVLMLIIPVAIQVIIGKYNVHELNEFSEWGTQERIINFSLIGVVFFVFVMHLGMSKKYNMTRPYLGAFLVAFILSKILFITSEIKDSKKGNFNLKHWVIAWVLAFFTRYPDSTWSELGSGIALSFVIFSFAVYKDNFNFYDCITDSTIRCNGVKVCDPVNEISIKDYGDANWYSITIISFFLFIFVMFSKFIKIL